MNKHLTAALQQLAQAQNLTIGEASHFKDGYGSEYITAEPFTVRLQKADARCGNRYALIVHLPNGVISPLTGYLTPQKIERELLSPSKDYAATIEAKRSIYSEPSN